MSWGLGWEATIYIDKFVLIDCKDLYRECRICTSAPK